MSRGAGKYLNCISEMKRVGVTQSEVADHLSMSNNNLYAKLNGRVPFTVPEVIDIREAFSPDAAFDSPRLHQYFQPRSPR